jgi:hypothetical protein
LPWIFFAEYIGGICKIFPENLFIAV